MSTVRADRRLKSSAEFSILPDVKPQLSDAKHICPFQNGAENDLNVA